LVGDRAIAVGKLLDHHLPRDNSAIGTAPLDGSANAMQAQFPDPLPYVDGYRLVLIPLQDVGENFGPDKSARQIADRQLIFGEHRRTRRGGIMLHGWAPFRETVHRFAYQASSGCFVARRNPHPARFSSFE
jgi:hypothetical protein